MVLIINPTITLGYYIYNYIYIIYNYIYIYYTHCGAPKTRAKLVHMYANYALWYIELVNGCSTG